MDFSALVSSSRTFVEHIDGVGEMRFRYPTFAEWYPLILEHAKHDTDSIPFDLVAATVALCLANEDGSRAVEDPRAIGEWRPQAVMGLYAAAKKVMTGTQKITEDTAGN